jgi:hypothetical protein
VRLAADAVLRAAGGGDHGRCLQLLRKRLHGWESPVLPLT